MALGCINDTNYFPAAFREVSFEAADVSSEHGRRAAFAEFPFGEEPAGADLGRKMRTYKIAGRFKENSHVADAEALIAAVETPGPGLLIHPTRGPVTVICTSLTMKDNPLEMGGVSEFDAEFSEFNDWVNGLNLGVGDIFDFGLDLGGLLDGLLDGFILDFIPLAVPFFEIVEAVAPAVNAILDIKDAIEDAASTSSKADRILWQSLVDLDRSANDPGVTSDATKVFETLRLGMSALFNYTSGDQQFQAFRKLANANAKSPTLVGNGGRTQNAVYSTMRALAGAYMAKSALSTRVSTITAALEQYRQVETVLLGEQMVARADCKNVLFLKLREFTTTTQAQLLNRAYNLPALISYRFSGGVHSLVAAYEIFNDAKRFKDIEASNPAAYPWRIGPDVVAERV